MDETSRRKLAWIYRHLSLAAAQWTDQTRVNPTPKDEERAWMYTWWDHVGSWYGFGISGPLGAALYDARLVWLDELDAMTDTELLAVPGIGRARLREIRENLDAYYWRTDHEASRA